MALRNAFENTATEATLAALESKTPALGQAAMAASTPVVIANNQSAVPVSATALPLPTGAATSALQTTGNTALSAIDTKLGGTLAVSVAALPLPTGAATEATLDSIRDNFVSYRESHSAGVHSLPALVSEESSGDLVTLKVDDNGALKVQLGTGAATETTLSALSDKINNTPSGALLVGTAADRFFENFATFDTVNDWEVVQTGTGMSITGPLGGAVAGSGPYLNISSGTTANQKTIILSRASFKPPVDLRYQITASQRIANNRCIVGFVQVDDTGAIVTATSITTAPDVLNARNAVVHQHDGTVATTSQLRVRAAGAALDTFANAFGTGFTTVATGSSPNFLSATTYALTIERDKILSRALGQNVLTNSGGQFTYDRTLVNPSVHYKMVIIIENQAAPASNTDWRFHLVNVLDATRFDVSPRNAGTADLSKAFPVTGTVAATVSGTVTANLGAANNRAGFFAAHGFWFDDSSTALAANATFTGTARDLLATATGVAWATATVMGKEFRVGAESDVSGTLWIEASRDNVNWRRVKSVATTAVTGGGHYAEIIHRPSWRYLRIGYTNGATVQARFTANSTVVAS
jgi:hypothetical protein